MLEVAVCRLENTDKTIEVSLFSPVSRCGSVRFVLASIKDWFPEDHPDVMGRLFKDLRDHEKERGYGGV